MMPTLENDTLLRALRREPTPYTPVWLMRQAGRYLPEYNATRREGRQLPRAREDRRRLATEVTLQPLERFPLDAAILFSDILTVPDAMGLGPAFAEGEGPRFARPLRDEAAIARSRVPDMDKLRYVFDAVARSSAALDGPRAADRLLGQPVHARLLHDRRRAAATTSAPCVKMLRTRGPTCCIASSPMSTREAVAAYLNAQIAAGAQAVMIFDTWGGVLSTRAYRRSRWPRCAPCWPRSSARRTAARADDRLHQGRRRSGSRRSPTCGAVGVGLDWTADLAQARRRAARASRCRAISIRMVLLDRPDAVRREASAIVRAAGRRRATSSTSATASCRHAARECRGAGRCRPRGIARGRAAA